MKMQLVAVAERTATAELTVLYSPVLVPELLTTRQPDGGEVRDTPLFSSEVGLAKTLLRTEADARRAKIVDLRKAIFAVGWRGSFG
jgi:hypothetical protein